MWKICLAIKASISFSNRNHLKQIRENESHYMTSRYFYYLPWRSPYYPQMNKFWLTFDNAFKSLPYNINVLMVFISNCQQWECKNYKSRFVKIIHLYSNYIHVYPYLCKQQFLKFDLLVYESHQNVVTNRGFIKAGHPAN